MKTTLNFPDDLISQAKIRAALEHTTLTGLITEGLKMRLQRSKANRKLPVSAAEGELEAKDVHFITGEIIDTHHILRRFIQSFHTSDRTKVLFIDEVNYIPDWDKTIKYIAVIGMTETITNTLRPLGNNTVTPLLQVLLQSSSGRGLFPPRGSR